MTLECICYIDNNKETKKIMKLLLEGNIASHYRAPIYQLMDKELNCDFCFGDKVGDIKKMDYNSLEGNVTEVHNILWHGIEYQRGVLELLKRDYDTYILYAGTHCVSSWLFLVVRKLFFRKKRLYIWSHGMLGKEKGIVLWLYKLLFSLFDGAFIYNERSREIMIKQGIPENKLFTIYNSLDYDRQLTLRNSLTSSPLYQMHFDNKNKNIVFIGRLTKVKRFDLLLDAIAHMKERGEFVNVTFIGDGVERANMEQRVKDLGVSSQVWFYGSCYDEKTNAELIYNADLCVSPGNIGLTAIHVLMFGCPAITNDDFNHQMPEFEAIKKGMSGDFFKVGDSVSLADTISRWFSQNRDNRELIRRFCYKEIDEKWNPHVQIEIFKNVLVYEKQ